MIECPECGGDTRVTDTLHNEGRTYRRRSCVDPKCGCIVHSVEVEIISEQDKEAFKKAVYKKNHKYTRWF